MKRAILFLFCLSFVPFVASGQLVLNTFDTVPDTNVMYVDNGPAGDITYVRVSQETNTVHSGTGALRIDWQNRCYDQYGGWIGLNFFADSGVVWDYSAYEKVTLWYYNVAPQTKPGEVEFRIILYDAGAGTSPETGAYEIWMSHHLILDKAPGWNKLVVALEDSGDNMAAWMPGAGHAFWNPGWGQTVDGNGILELNKVVGWRFEFSQNATYYQAADDSVSGIIILDDFSLEGVRPVNLVCFNGKATPGEVNLHTGWSGSVEITDEEAYTPGTNSVKWTVGSGWDGPNFDFANKKNLLMNWSGDSLQFKIKAPAGLGDLTLNFQDIDEDTTNTLESDWGFIANYILHESDVGFDGTWKHVKIPLRDFNRFAGVWSNELNQTVPGEFDSTKIVRFFITGTGQADWPDKAYVVYLDDIWTGNPEFDWIPPEQVANVDAVQAQYYNLVIWEDVAGETGETYNVYASEKPITSLSSNDVERIATRVLEDTKTTVHWIYYPLKNDNTTYYYAVECVDASGNVGPAGMSSAISNMAKGIPTVSLNPPANFAADGDISEWEASGIKPWVLTPEKSHVSTGVVSDSTDLKATVYLAADDNYFYVAFDVIDNVYAYSPDGNWYQWDAFEMAIGLYDERGNMHATTPESNRGKEPDYKFVFQNDRMFSEFRPGGMADDIIYTNADNNYEFIEYGGADYSGEAKIPWDSVQIGSDVRFHPVRGMRIPIELTFHDNDGDGSSTDQWEGNLTFSPKDDDNAWQYVWQWATTWIGDTTQIVTDVIDNTEVPTNFALSQNYPNPFNPTTTIEYALAKTGKVELSIFNMMGQKIRALVNQNQPAGVHKIQWDGRDNAGALVASGVYIYQLKAKDITLKKKLMFIK